MFFKREGSYRFEFYSFFYFLITSILKIFLFIPPFLCVNLGMTMNVLSLLDAHFKRNKKLINFEKKTSFYLKFRFFVILPCLISGFSASRSEQEFHPSFWRKKDSVLYLFHIYFWKNNITEQLKHSSDYICNENLKLNYELF